jgi:hypothetical protein
MSFCPQCGRQRGANARFCGSCGIEFGQPAAGGEAARAADRDGPASEPADQAGGERTRLDMLPEQVRLDAAGQETRAEPTRLDVVGEETRAAPTRLDTPAEPVALATAEQASGEQAGGEHAGGEQAALDAVAGQGPAEQTRLDVPLGQTRWDSPADTEYAEPAGAAGYSPFASPASPRSAPPQPVPVQSGPAYPPPGVPGQRSGGRGTAILVVVVILVALGAGGGAYALTRSQGGAAPPSQGNPTVTAQASAGTPAVQGSTSPTVGASPPPTASPSVSVTPSPTRTGTVRVAAGVAGDPAEPRVEAYLNRYFSAINSRNYNAYNSLLDAQEQQNNSQSTFESGYATTKDSNEVLTGIEHPGGGNLTANVSFTSRQNPADSVDGSACNNWHISLYLVEQGNSYVMTAAPGDYHAGYSDC